VLNNRTDGNVLIIDLNRAESGNALNQSLQLELIQAWRDFDYDDNLRVAVLQGASNVFSLGHDVHELLENPSLSPVADNAFFPLHISKPVIAAVEGPCYGLGFELALSCDLRVAGAGAQFGLADPNLFVPYRVASVLLPRMTFLGKSLEMIYSGKVMGAADMQQARLVNQVTSTGQAASTALEMAKGMAQRFPSRQAFRKQDIWSLSGVSLPAAMNMARQTIS
jgi:enoyl-CoA hydratase